jgi:hypothetical protein
MAHADHVEGTSIFAAVVPAPRSLAVDGDDLGHTGAGLARLAQAFYPGGEALGEERAIDGIDDVIERIVAGDTRLEGQQAAQ